MKGKIPNTEMILIDSTINQWKLLEKGLINSLSCSGILKRTDDQKVKINITLLRVISPQNNLLRSKSKIVSNKEEKIHRGVERLCDYFDEFSTKTLWVLTGYINGKNKVPILIFYYELFNISIYTIKFTNESYTDFLPEGVLPPKKE